MNGSQLKHCGYEGDETIPERNDEKPKENSIYLFIRDKSGESASVRKIGFLKYCMLYARRTLL